MTSDEEPDCGNESDLQPIPEELQDILTEELVESDYEAVRPTGSEDGGDGGGRSHGTPAFNPPGRTRQGDSVNASSDDTGGSAHVDAYSAGYDSPMATRIGDEEDGDGDAERLRELHDGRHHSDGDLSTRQSQWDKTRIAEAICSALPLAQHERDKVLSVVKNLDFSKFGQQKGLERVTLGVVAVMVDERYRQQLDGDPEIVSFSDKFKGICRKHEIAMSDLSTIKEIVREALDSGNAKQGHREPQRDILLPEPTPLDDYPREYWEDSDPEYWVGRAKAWPRLPDEFKQAIPEDYRKLVQNLRRWEPWEEAESEYPQEEARLTELPITPDEEIKDLSTEARKKPRNSSIR